MMLATTKICTGCKESKLLSEYSNNPACRLGKQSRCRACIRKAKNEEYRIDPEKFIKRTQEYRDKNREAVRANSRRYYRDNATELKRKKIEHYRTDPEKYKAMTRAVKLKTAYGLTGAQYDAMFKEQRGRCLICGGTQAKRLTVDHCHETNKVRGLLCSNCNSGIGLLRDDVDNLKAAIYYIEKFKNKKVHG